MNDDWQKLPLQFGKRERLKTFSKYFLPERRERERDGYVDLASGHYGGPRVCLLGWFCKKIPAREREMR